ncbi:alpha/beta fold hydrolase [Brasilonema bromeliae]|uniref:Alpha/beta hydrolase n=1 Tax=Brasilonema bromeliae SPC951 TaxID=385972 RepID=A0ABX1P3X1_9CYAN|nr:alpha/beta hydrolase [Brasilonema bromeliae]NMG18723.1 alpha/beta hydrolase [Brasilonema bromeliae SPC951]
MSLLCLVHGAYLGAWCWDLLTPEIEARGHQTVAVDLPIEDPTAGVAQYAEVVSKALQGFEDDVVLVGHSMAGLIIPLVASQRPVRQLVFIAGVIPHIGVSLLDQSHDEPDPNLLKAIGYELPEADKFEQFSDEPNMFNPAALGKNLLQDEAVAREFLFHDCASDVASWAFPKLRNQQFLYISEVSPLQAWPDVKCTYIVCGEDRSLSPAWCRYAARKRLGVDAIELPQSSHCPMLSHPAQLADILAKVAST